MIIGIDASRANKPQKTGVEWYSYHLIEEFKKMAPRHQYFLYTNQSLTGALAQCPSNFKEIRLKWPIPRSWTIGRLSWEMKFGKYRPDVLFVPAHTLPLLNPKKSVVTIHDIGFEHFPAAYHWADKLYHKLIIQIIKRSATTIITPSQFTKDDIIRTYGLAPEKISVVHNGYDSTHYRQFTPEERVTARQTLKDKYHLDTPFILFIGRLELKKNIPRLVAAFAQFKARRPAATHKLVLIGAPGLTFHLVAKQIKKFKLEKDIIMPGWVGDDDLPIFLNAAELFVFPSLFEGFGIPVLEAMACGCPVICSNTTSLPEVAGDSALMFDPADTEAITGAMESLLVASASDPAAAENPRQALITRGLTRAQQFSWAKTARQILTILEK